MAVPSLALTSLSIRDFRGIHELDLDFRGPDGNPNQLVVLAGPNGCGKTAVLEAGLLALGGSGVVTGPTGPGAIRRGAKKLLIHADVWYLGQVKEAVVEEPGARYSPAFHQVSPAWHFSSWRTASLVGAVNPSIGGPEPILGDNDKNRLLNVKRILVNGACIERFRDGQPPGGRHSEVIRVINDAWREFYPGRNDYFAVDIVRSSKAGDGAFNVFLCTEDGVHLEIDFLSSGQVELFLFISTLALNYGREGIVFIDEPELHLDPQWHRSILRCLMRLQRYVQFIVATHSPEIYDEAQFYERHFLVPEDDPRAHLWPSVKSVEAGG